MKKIKLITSLSTLGVLSSSVAVIATGCSCSAEEPKLTPSIPKGQTFGASTEIKSGETLKGQLAVGDQLTLTIPEGKTPTGEVDWALDTDPKIENLKVDEDYKFLTPSSVQRHSSNADVDYQKMFEVIVAKNFQKNTLYTITATDHDTKEVLAKFTFRTPDSTEPFIGAVEADLVNCTWTPAASANADVPNLGSINVKSSAATSGIKLVAANLPDGKSASETVNYVLTADGLSPTYDATTGITLTAEDAATVIASSGITLNITAVDKTESSTEYAKASITLKKYDSPTPPTPTTDAVISATPNTKGLQHCEWVPAAGINDDIPNLGTIKFEENIGITGLWGVMLSTSNLPTGKTEDDVKYELTATGVRAQSSSELMYVRDGELEGYYGILMSGGYAGLIQNSPNAVTINITAKDKTSGTTYAHADISIQKYLTPSSRTISATGKIGGETTLADGMNTKYLLSDKNTEATLTISGDSLDSDPTWSIEGASGGYTITPDYSNHNKATFKVTDKTILHHE